MGSGVTSAYSNTGSVQDNGEVGEDKACKGSLTTLPDVSGHSLDMPLVVCPGGVFHQQSCAGLADLLPSVHLRLKVMLAEIQPLIGGWLVFQKGSFITHLLQLL